MAGVAVGVDEVSVSGTDELWVAGEGAGVAAGCWAHALAGESAISTTQPISFNHFFFIEAD